MAMDAQGTTNGHEAGFLGNVNLEDATQIMEHTKEAMDQAVETAATFIRERPLVCLAGALALGYVVGKIVSR